MSTLKKMLCAILLLATALHAQEGGDLQAQILYAYCTEDTNSLTNLIQGLNAKLRDATDDTALRYHLAHAQYRFGQLAGDDANHRGEKALSECIDELKPLLKDSVKSVEALVLQGACYGALANVSGMQAVVLRARAADRLQEATKLAPRNPRLLLVEAMQGLAHAKRGSPERQHALVQLNMAAMEFDASSATSIEAPGWGHAQAYLAMGSEMEAGGDTVGARNWIEKALIAAPDYKAAQRQLASLGKR